MVEEATALERQYCPPIDPSLFRALLPDYDISDEASLSQLRDVLEILKHSAQEDSNSSFDPTGTSRHEDKELLTSSNETSSSHDDSYRSTSENEALEISSISTEFEKLNIELTRKDVAQINSSDSWDILSVDQRQAVLQEMFPNIKNIDIAFTVRKTGDNYGQAIEELLNQVFLEADVDETGRQTFQRGIDGFSDTSNRSRKKKNAKSQLHRRTSSTPAPSKLESVTGNGSSLSRWEGAKADIDFITHRTHLQRSTVASFYHKQGASIAAALSALCDSVDTTDEDVPAATAALQHKQVEELGTEFPSLSPSRRQALTTLTFPSSAAAHELARTMTSSSNDFTTSSLLPSYRPRSPSPDSKVGPRSPRVLNVLGQNTQQLASTRTQAYQQAAAAHRLSKSKPLMGGAAAYYSAVARDTSTAMRERQALAADELVTSQSRNGKVDLHGTSVQDAVRISKEEVEQWWEKQAGEWAQAGKTTNGALVLVTGKGQHSQGGKGRLGPAVGKMLVKEGWRVEVGDGVIEVLGKMRR